MGLAGWWHWPSGSARVKRSGSSGLMWTSIKARYAYVEAACGPSMNTAAVARADTSLVTALSGGRSGPTLAIPSRVLASGRWGCPLIALFRKHKRIQEEERIKARQLWYDEGWVFTKLDGRPLNPNTDYHEWKELLADAGLRDVRLHNARHTAATVLLILGVPTPTAMALMGWSSAAMAKRYQHLIDTIRRDVAKQVGGLLWDADDALYEPAAGANETRNETRPELGPEC